MTNHTGSTEPTRLRDERIQWSVEFRTAVMVARRELIRFVRARPRLIGSLLQPLMFLLLLGYGLTPLISTAGDVSFMQFLLPGIVAMSLVTTAGVSGFSVAWDREFGFLREMLVAPPTRTALVSGKIAGNAIVATIQGVILLLLAPFLGISLGAQLFLGAIGVQAITATALTAFAVFIASRVQKMESYHILMQLTMLPMIFLSGAMFPLRDLPTWLSVLAHLNPLTYAVDPLRRVVLSDQPAAAADFEYGLQILGHTVPIAAELAVLAIFTLIFAAAASRGFRKLD